ncbi:hypothetical protein [Actinomadura roseirufa]|uniref:hypothetical protein n=1 Tax=Actinomadura roseirufa TaxID=2094049 RepID=UPI0010419795|nr:hypothetical protein [Actinomadura roseirufa]
MPPPDIGSLAAGLDALGARGGRVHRLIRRARAPRLRRARFAIRRFRPPALLDDRPPRHEPKRGGR